MPDDGETIDIQEPAEKKAEVIESVEQRIELTESNKDSDVPNRGDSVIRRREGLKKSGRRTAKVNENASLFEPFFSGLLDQSHRFFSCFCRMNIFISSTPANFFMLEYSYIQPKSYIHPKNRMMSG